MASKICRNCQKLPKITIFKFLHISDILVNCTQIRIFSSLIFFCRDGSNEESHAKIVKLKSGLQHKGQPLLSGFADDDYDIKGSVFQCNQTTIFLFVEKS